MSGVIRPLDLIIFDLDGVLVASDSGHARAYDELWELIGIEGPPYSEIAGRRTADVVRERIREAGITGDLDAWTRFKQERARHHLLEAPIVFPDTRPALERFRRLAPLAIGTGASRETAELLAARIDPLRRFVAIVTAEDVTRGKPAPDVYLTVLARVGVPAEATLVIEDSTAGVQAAVAAGTMTAVVRNERWLEEEPDRRVIGWFPDLLAVADALGAPA